MTGIEPVRAINPRDFKSRASASSATSAMCLEAAPRFELGDKGFADLCLTTWLCRHFCKHLCTDQYVWVNFNPPSRDIYIHKIMNYKFWSGKRDSNSRPSPWQGDALPLSYFRIFNINFKTWNFKLSWCHEPESNQRHEDFQSSALPTELSWHWRQKIL